MKFYSVLIHLGGDVLNQVLKPDVSAAEVLLLNEMHGGSGVAKLDFVREAEINHRVLRKSLETRYGGKPVQMELIQRLFGAASARLPESVTLADLRLPESSSEEEEAPEDVEGDTLPEPVSKPPTAPEKPPEDARDVLRASIKALGGSVPGGNLSEARLREILTMLQKEKLGITEDQDDKPAEPAGVM